MNPFSDTVHIPYYSKHSRKDCDKLQFTFIVVCQFRNISKSFRLQCSRRVKICHNAVYFVNETFHSRLKSTFLNFNFIFTRVLDVPILTRKRRKFLHAGEQKNMSHTNHLMPLLFQKLIGKRV